MKILFVSISVLALSFDVYADIYKCVHGDGRIYYQNYPCYGSGTNHTSPQRKLLDSTALKLGMTKEEVAAQWGYPLKYSKKISETGEVEVWEFRGKDQSGVLVFKNDRLISIEVN